MNTDTILTALGENIQRRYPSWLSQLISIESRSQWMYGEEHVMILNTDQAVGVAP